MQIDTWQLSTVLHKRRNQLEKHFKKWNSAISYYWIVAVICIV